MSDDFRVNTGPLSIIVATDMVGGFGKDGKILQVAREEAKSLLSSDSELNDPSNKSIRKHIDSLSSSVVNWSRIS